MCQEMSSKLDNLATVMNLYSHKTFTKDSFQWTKCVVKYLYDVYSSMHESLIAFLIEVSSCFKNQVQPVIKRQL